MKKQKLSSLLGIFLTGLSCVWLPGCAAWERTTSSDMDTNSGDYRYQEYRGKRLVKNVIGESALSKEARRLGIGLPAERKWKPMSRSHPGKFYGDYTCGFLMGVCNELVSVLDRTNTLDEERRVILEGFLRRLRTEDPYHLMNEGRFLVLGIADKHGIHFYATPVEEELRKMRAQRRSQAAPVLVQASVVTGEESGCREESAGPPEAQLRRQAEPGR